MFQIEPSGNGWKYPIPGGGYRWKNADSDAASKYIWPDGKPETADFYHAQDLGNAIRLAGGVCWLVSGEADVWAMHSASIGHVLSGFTENKISDNLVSYLESLGVEVLSIAPDLDNSGARWARLVTQVLHYSPIELDARQLPENLGTKGDIGKAWQTYTKKFSFERWLLGLPRFIPELPKAKAKRKITSYSPVPLGYRQLIANLLDVSEYKPDGNSKNIICPFHDDTKPSATLHDEIGLYCQVCGYHLWREIGIKIGAGSIVEWRMSSGLFLISTQIREVLITAKLTHLSRMFDALSIAGWKSGRQFTRKEAVNACNGLLSYSMIRQATEQLETTFCGFLPSFSLELVQREKTRKKSRPPKIYQLPTFRKLSQVLGVQSYHFDEMNPEKIKNAADYKAEVYAAMPRRIPGEYYRATLAERVGVSNRTAVSYDKRAGLKVTSNFDRTPLTTDDIAILPDSLPKKRKYNIWLETEGSSKRYPPIKRFAKELAEVGTVIRVEQFRNSYSG